MKKTLLLFVNVLKRSKLFLLIALAAGLLLCLIYDGMAGMYDQASGGIPIGFYPHEESAVTSDLRSYLQDELGMALTESTDMEFLNTELVERRVAAVVEVPEGFEAAVLNGTELPLDVSFLDDYANSMFVMAYLENYTASLSMLAAGAEGSAETLQSMLEATKSEMIPLAFQQAEDEALRVETQKAAFRQVIGFFLMFCFILAFALSSQLLDDRKNGMYARMKASDLRTVQYLVGTCLPSVLCSALLTLPLIVYMGLTAQAIGIRLWQVLLLCLLYALFVVGVSIVVALYASSRNAISAIIIGAATITCMLGGAYFPIETAPAFLQQLARATPQFWFMDTVDILQADATGAFWQNALVLCLFALVLFIVAGIRFVGGGKKRVA